MSLIGDVNVNIRISVNHDGTRSMYATLVGWGVNLQITCRLNNRPADKLMKAYEILSRDDTNTEDHLGELYGMLSDECRRGRG